VSSAYRGRHRSASAAGRPSPVQQAVRRPAVASSLALALATTTAAGVAASAERRPQQAAFTVSTEAVQQANELSDRQIEETADLAAARQDLNATRAAAQERARRQALAAQAAAARARREAALQAARAKERAALEAKRRAAIADARRDPRAAARALVADHGWGEGQFSCLDKLWQKESGWNYKAVNPSSGAWGIPQALPGSKMGTVAPDWRENPATQIRWGLQYIAGRYGTPCAAWGHSQAVNWY
jgi:hypothetical protein